MTDQDYEQKKYECWKEFWDEISGNIDFAPGVDDRMKEHIYDTFARAYALGKQETKQETDADETDAEETVISGWVARDSDGNLFMYSIKPERDEALQVWIGRYANCGMRINLFPDLTWDSDPESVEIIIKRKKK